MLVTHKKRLSSLFILFTSLALLLAACGGGGGGGGIDGNGEVGEEDQDNNSFSYHGNWVVEDKWEGCGQFCSFTTFIKIEQTGDFARLYFMNPSDTMYGQYLDCRIDAGGLQCSGPIYSKTNRKTTYETYTLYPTQENNFYLEGHAEWILGENQCSGRSDLSARTQTTTASNGG